MQTSIVKELLETPDGREADRILRTCVHCGFCTATCPTYRLLGDELDGPRGRIYLIKSLLEGRETTAKTRLHLDRCLTCRACETTCPSGVEYGHLVDIGRHHIETRLERPLLDRLFRRALRAVLPHRNRFELLLRLGRFVRPVLPRPLKKRIPKTVTPGRVPKARHDRRVILFQGCVQPGLSPRTNAALARVLDRLAISTVVVSNEECCGALEHHMSESGAAKQRIKNNIDQWWPLINSGDVEAIVTSASGCGVMIKDYGFILRDDPDYADRAATIAGLCRDVVEIFNETDTAALEKHVQPPDYNVVFQEPCTLQHGQQLRGKTADLLRQLGFRLNSAGEESICCGSAGIYSLLQPTLSGKLRENKLKYLLADNPAAILTANIGCQIHLQQESGVPVRHWIEEVDAALVEG